MALKAIVINLNEYLLNNNQVRKIIECDYKDYTLVRHIARKIYITSSIEQSLLIPIYNGKILHDDCKITDIDFIENKEEYILFLDITPRKEKVATLIPPSRSSIPSSYLTQGLENNQLLMTLFDNLLNPDITNSDNEIVDEPLVNIAVENTTTDSTIVIDTEDTITDISSDNISGNSQQSTYSLLHTVNSLLNASVSSQNIYIEELKHLQELGFYNNIYNLEALQIADGNVEIAVNYLFENNL